jgi:hypothetical protein
VPRLLDTKKDPHAKVQAGAKKALVDIGSVIKCPEIKTLSTKLLAALSDPSLGKSALQALMNTSFRSL